MDDRVQEECIAGQRSVYGALFAEHGRSEAALNWSKAKQELRFAALTRLMPDGPMRLLDYGCGLGDLKTWLAANRPGVDYLGVDILADFIASNRTAHGSDDFQAISGPEDIGGMFDYVVLSGVFNLRTAEPGVHRALLQSTLAALFAKTRRVIAIDFLASDVDFRNPAGWHQEPGEIVDFIAANLSRRLLLDKSYLPYEYCITLFKDAEIERPRNVYAHDTVTA